MNFEFFMFLIFMSVISFAVAFLAYALVVRCMGKEGALSRWTQIICIPACVIFFDFICIASGEYKYWVGSIPLALIGLILLYYYFIKGESVLGEQTPSQMAAAQNQVLEPKKFSKKSQRIHEARKKRGGR
ncbi:MAG: hypothetical protein IJV92_01935 [Phascolarctobacterium sp.]|nr:hypothetical protein [Phascolarctobacterium sp.]